MNGLEAEWGQRVKVVQVNVHRTENRALLDRLRVQFTPTFVLFAADGSEVWRQTGSIDAAAARQAVDALTSS
ncbi:MAG: thioredoxin family protein [Candidatus Promineifilaceae bacterium]|nr:thioredoxin family protein [Candidatus Promineifilaceae bacterium]